MSRGKRLISTPRKKGLSRLQRTILSLAAEKETPCIEPWEILHRVYGFEITRSGRLRFDRGRIGIKRYLAATVSVCKALNRLAARGLGERVPNRGIYLKAAGLDVVRG
jgi:hypothetical protein